MARPSFKDLMQEDVNEVFMNNYEFSNKHLVNGKRMDVIFDSLEQVEREKRIDSSVKEQGIYSKNILVYIKKSEYGPLPAPGNLLTLDNRKYRVTDAINEDGLYSISLEAVKS